MIIINGTKPINDKQQWIFMTITIDGDMCKFTHVVPIEPTGQSLQDYVDTKEDSYKFDILKDMYPKAQFNIIDGQTRFQAFEQWISNGCINPDETIIEKKPFQGTHPFETQEKAITAKDAMSEIVDMTYAQLDDYIEANVTDLATSKAFIKKLGKVTLAILKRSDWSD